MQTITIISKDMVINNRLFRFEVFPQTTYEQAFEALDAFRKELETQKVAGEKVEAERVAAQKTGETDGKDS